MYPENFSNTTIITNLEQELKKHIYKEFFRLNKDTFDECYFDWVVALITDVYSNNWLDPQKLTVKKLTNLLYELNSPNANVDYLQTFIRRTLMHEKVDFTDLWSALTSVIQSVAEIKATQQLLKKLSTNHQEDFSVPALVYQTITAPLAGRFSKLISWNNEDISESWNKKDSSEPLSLPLSFARFIVEANSEIITKAREICDPWGQTGLLASLAMNKYQEANGTIPQTYIRAANEHNKKLLELHFLLCGYSDQTTIYDVNYGTDLEQILPEAFMVGDGMTDSKLIISHSYANKGVEVLNQIYELSNLPNSYTIMSLPIEFALGVQDYTGKQIFDTRTRLLAERNITMLTLATGEYLRLIPYIPEGEGNSKGKAPQKNQDICMVTICNDEAVVAKNHHLKLFHLTEAYARHYLQGHLAQYYFEPKVRGNKDANGKILTPGYIEVGSTVHRLDVAREYYYKENPEDTLLTPLVAVKLAQQFKARQFVSDDEVYCELPYATLNEQSQGKKPIPLAPIYFRSKVGTLIGITNKQFKRDMSYYQQQIQENIKVYQKYGKYQSKLQQLQISFGNQE